VPGLLALGVVVLSFVRLVPRAGLSAGTVGLGLVPLVLLVLSGLALPGVGALTGPPLVAAALAAALLILGREKGGASSSLFLAVVLLVHLAAAWQVHRQVGPHGDEPHYLMVADSLLKDGDLAVEADYEAGRYRGFHPGPLRPHYLVRGREGVIYSQFPVGLSLLILPAYALAGYTGAALFMGLVTALVAWETRGLLRDVLGGPGDGGGAPGAGVAPGAEAVAWVIALSPPLLHYAGLVFTEAAAALIVVVVLRHARGLAGRPWWVALTIALVAASLPWLNIRYAPVSVLLLVYVLWHRRDVRGWLTVAAASLGSAGGIVLYHWVLYGFLDPRRVYGKHQDLSLFRLPEGLGGLLFDQEFGLLVYAPVFTFAAVGFVFLVRRARVTGLVALAVTLVTLGVAGSWVMWRGGFNPPSRFLLPVVPALALAVGAALPRGLTAPAALLAGWSLFAGLGGALQPRLVHRDRDGTAPFFREMSGAEEWTRLLPGYVLPETARDREPLTVVWGIALLVAVLPRGRGRRDAPRDGAGRLVLATAGMLAAAGVASVASHGPTGGRDAVRVVGRPALQVPGWRVTAHAPARWGTEGLDWGPLYEPHRHPAGAVIGERLPLPPGRYELRLLGESFGEPPAVTVQASPALEPVFGSSLLPRGDGLVGEIVVPPGQRETTLRLEGGGAMRIDQVELRIPFAR
jgi:hypothetical protein